MGYIGALDQGTTGTRFLTFDGDGDPVSDNYVKHRQIYPQQGWVEHDPREIYRNVLETVRKTPNNVLEELEAVGVTNQRETTIVWDQDGEPVYNGVVWQDRRTTDRIDDLEPELRSRIRDTTGLIPNSYFSGTKLEWILENYEEETNHEGKNEVLDLSFGTVDSYLVYMLTDGEKHVTDVTNASRTMLYDIHNDEWSPPLLEEFSVPREILPTVVPSYGEIHGYTDFGGVLDKEVPIGSILGDQQASLFGHCCFEEGDTKNTYGTGSFLLTNTGYRIHEDDHGLLRTIGYQCAGEPPMYALEAPVFMTGGVLEWLVDLGLIRDAGETEEIARGADTGELFLVPAFTGLGAPYWDEKAAGTLIGITRDTDRRSIVRAALESIAYQTLDVVETLRDNTDLELGKLRVDGGVSSNDLMCELQADYLDLEVERPEHQEVTALGAAYSAGLTTGFWSSREEVSRLRSPSGRFEAGGYGHSCNHEGWRRAVSRSKDWRYNEA
ncbi:MAG: FGGY family carbohydrate kinase [Halobacteria archaeon]